MVAKKFKQDFKDAVVKVLTSRKQTDPLNRRGTPDDSITDEEYKVAMRELGFAFDQEQAQHGQLNKYRAGRSQSGERTKPKFDPVVDAWRNLIECAWDDDQN